MWSCSKGAAEEGLLILARLDSSIGGDAEEAQLENSGIRRTSRLGMALFEETMTVVLLFHHLHG